MTARPLPRRPPARRAATASLLVATLVAAALGGCARALHPTVSDTRGGHPLIRLAEAGDGGPVDVPVNEIRVVPDDGGQWDYRHPAWCVTLDPGTYQALSTVRYGERPAGFDRCGGPTPLQPGRRYLVSVSGAGTTAKVEFVAGL